MQKLLYNIGEVAQILNENVSTVRFWSDSFPFFIRPKRNAKGNRQFTAEDIETFKEISYLLRVRRLTIEGAAKLLRDDRRKVNAEMRVLESLRSIHEQLVNVRKSMK